MNNARRQQRASGPPVAAKISPDDSAEGVRLDRRVPEKLDQTESVRGGPRKSGDRRVGLAGAVAKPAATSLVTGTDCGATAAEA